MTVLGAIALPQLPPERLPEIAEAAEQSGLAELWLWEDCFWAAGSACAATVLANTERLRVGIGVLPVPLRNVALTAMELAAVLRMHPGRLIPGIGHGVQDWMGQVGARVDSPLTLLREQLTALRALLHGETVDASGAYVHLDRVALDWPPHTPPSLAAGASGPRTLRLSGELADATVLTSATTPDGIRAARELIDEGRAKAGRTEPHRVIVYLLAATGRDAAERLAATRRRTGLPDAVGVAGDAQAIADAVHRWSAAGADTVVLEPTPDEPDPLAFVRFAGEQVRPLVE
ncbi:LLM class flavin-dependent oxidoreductase [Nocardia bhagyanarayanae]|uniref:LLM class flavin-dependent oxidoreductase n=1 Tax=Nocardia bhagyanarayanae TaxID=1215925 RepID=UPI0011536ABB|nr:LLM class flavin-dependent oxidoreductase [Nocardia bhagyanarayanae]